MNSDYLLYRLRPVLTAGLAALVLITGACSQLPAVDLSHFPAPAVDQRLKAGFRSNAVRRNETNTCNYDPLHVLLQLPKANWRFCQGGRGALLAAPHGGVQPARCFSM